MSLKLFVSFVLLFLVNTIRAAVSDEVDVVLSQGVLRGNTEETYWSKQKYLSFKGIPYAKPPVGGLRFLPPVKHEGWEDVLKAYETKPTCMQYNAHNRIGEPYGISGSEDCLFINVFTPSLTNALPVVVYDYNDNFKTGFNFTETYAPDFLIEENVIVVHISHRLGLLGYLTTGDDVIPGNNGIRDFILGLEWLKENINKFGGDPDKITIMGSRGGAALVDILLRTEQAKGLFNAAIMQSGSALEIAYFYPDPRGKAFELAAALDIDAEDSKSLLESLQNVSAEALVEKELSVFNTKDEEKAYQLFAHPFTPVVEGDKTNAIIKDYPEKLSIVNDVPLLIGYNSREGLDVASLYITNPIIIKEITDIAFYFPIRPKYRFDVNSLMFEEVKTDVKRFYLKSGYFHTGNTLEFSVYMGDVFHTYAINQAMKLLAGKLESPTYFYVFDFRGSLNENSEYLQERTRYPLEKRGATAADELCYLHLCSRIKKNYDYLRNLISEQPEIKVLKKTLRLWTNFIKHRNPTPEKQKELDQVIWKPVDPHSEDIDFLHICKRLHMKTNPFEDRMTFWDNLLAKYAEKAIDGVVKDENIHEEL